MKAWAANELPTEVKYGGHSLHSANHQHPGPSIATPPKKLEDGVLEEDIAGTISVFAIFTVYGVASFAHDSSHWAESPSQGVFQSQISLINVLAQSFEVNVAYTFKSAYAESHPMPKQISPF